MSERESQTEIVEQLQTLCPDVIIVHGSGLHMSKKTESGYKSSWDARMRLTAAGGLWEGYHDQGKNVKVMVVGGDNYPTLAPSIAETMKEVLMRIGIPEKDIVVVGEGGNTVSDDEQIIEVMQREGFGNAIDISSGYHEVERFLSGKRGTRFVSAEEILKERHRFYPQVITDIYESQSIKDLIKSQEHRVLLLSIPVFGKGLYEWLSRKLRGRGPEGGAVVTVFDPYGLQKMAGKKK